MFTGIVSGLGTLVERRGSRFVIAAPYKKKSLEEGASVACDGCCLTLVDIDKAKEKGAGSVFAVEVSNETLAHTTLGTWQPGQRINLERALALGEELGGHIVTGHVDARAKVVSRYPDGDSVRVLIEVPPELAGFVAPKGSIALNGVSLTVNDVDGERFGVNIIPYTLTHTTWGDRQPGDLVNLEVDLLARYVARLSQYESRRT
ncbi:riboflavin synthase subunit alpha [Methyloceanibacter superfactus]|jgi:riboflavin synthase|uniref:Riboflavin synthase n=1 Tax=Methyloceanibacter superfactus TaxID=1774969 RepID=A0A1E3VL56_9HYPH|nr:riboflavin synthase [Methyloceanibacter superfactus]ODR94280.1 riboflavin synthase subunit alpha [Methyloceanibacter superfactus]